MIIGSLLVEELHWFEMSITDVIDTNWFGQGVYEVTWFVMINSGQPLLGGDNLDIKNESL